ncbi:MAG TPA: hypothetical protein VFN88_13170 [Caulobacteraceae bacterium]|nr:hypothetical protein [Caulobacteraceae bacterium]
MARTRGYDPGEAALICDGLAEGKSLACVLRENPDLPRNSTVMRWLAEHEDFRELYELARRFQAEVLFDEIREIADGENAQDPWRASLRVSSRKWMVARMHPKKYGAYPCHRRWAVEGDRATAVIEVITGVPDDDEDGDEG